MHPRIGRWLIPALAALAVLLVVGALWQLRPGSSGEDVGSAGPSSSDPGTGDPEPLPPTVSPPTGGGAGPDTIAATGFHAYDETRLAIVYTNGVPACYGSAGRPRVEETADSITVTIPRIPPGKTGSDVACIDIALVDSVEVTLDAPLGDRAVLDGSRGGAPLPRQSPPTEEGAN